VVDRQVVVWKGFVFFSVALMHLMTSLLRYPKNVWGIDDSISFHFFS